MVPQDPPPPPTSPVSPLGVPGTGAQKGGGGSGKGARTPPPPRRASQFSASLNCAQKTAEMVSRTTHQRVQHLGHQQFAGPHGRASLQETDGASHTANPREFRGWGISRPLPHTTPAYAIPPAGKCPRCCTQPHRHAAGAASSTALCLLQFCETTPLGRDTKSDRMAHPKAFAFSSPGRWCD